MAFIQDVPPERAEGRLARLYARGRDQRTGRIDNILTIHGLAPGALDAHLAMYFEAMRPTPGLPLVERELIAVTVSWINRCEY